MAKITFACLDELVLQDTTVHPKPISEVIPEWYKNVPTNLREEYPLDYLSKIKTVKQCPSFVDIFKYGYVLLAPTDIVLKYSKQNADFTWETPYSWKTNNNNKPISFHSNGQFVDHLPSNSNYNFVFKINLPFNVFTPKDYMCIQLPYPYSFNDDWTSIYGKFDTSKVHETNIQIVHTSKKEEIVIKKGTPLSLYIPVKKDTLDIEVVDFNKRKDLQKRYAKYNYTMNSKFHHAYRDL